MDEKFRSVIEHIFNNWTGLQLAINHGMAGPNSKQVAVDCIEYMTTFCLSNNNDIDLYTIQEELEIIMDQEFNTVFEDGSTREIAERLYRFSILYKNRNFNEFEAERMRLPHNSAAWLSQSVAASPQPSQVHTSTPHSTQQMPVLNEAQHTEENVEMDEDDQGWTSVPSRRRRF